MGNGRSVRGCEKNQTPGLNKGSKRAPARRGACDRAGNRKQSGWIGQQAGLGKRAAMGLRDQGPAIAYCVRGKGRLSLGRADRGDRERRSAREAVILGLPLSRFLKAPSIGAATGNAVVALSTRASPGRRNLTDEHHLVVALADQDLWVEKNCGGSTRDQRGDVDGRSIGGVVGFFLIFSVFPLRSFRYRARFVMVVAGSTVRDFVRHIVHAERHCTPTRRRKGAQPAMTGSMSTAGRFEAARHRMANNPVSMHRIVATRCGRR